jgi:hypothetical protein
MAAATTSFPGRLPASRGRAKEWVICLLLVLGLYLPTSTAAGISKILEGISYTICLCLIATISDIKQRPTARLLLLSIVPLLAVFTFLSRLSSFTPGALLPYATLSVLYCANLPHIDVGSLLRRTYVAVNSLNIALCFGIIIGIGSVQHLFTTYYSVFYPELVPDMMFLHKPVLTFGTHSLAAFYLYIFFYVNLRSYGVLRKKYFLFSSICYILLSCALLSVTGLILAAVAAIQLVWTAVSQLRRSALIIVLVLLVSTFSVAELQDVSFSGAWLKGISAAAQAVMNSPNNGFHGRFGPDGNLYPDIQYISTHWRLPIGVTHRSDLVVVDCGFLEHMLRGSFPLLFLVYGGLYLFLKDNLLASRDCYFLFAAILAFEVGFSSLMYARTLYLLPALAVYLNSLHCNKTVGAAGEVSPHATEPLVG